MQKGIWFHILSMIPHRLLKTNHTQLLAVHLLSLAARHDDIAFW
jgi:hypothetical protein